MFSFESTLCSLSCLLFKAIWLRSSLCALCVLLWQSALADVRYVDVNSTNATPPYTRECQPEQQPDDATNYCADRRFLAPFGLVFRIEG
jgi:hypothetical protein